MTLYHHSSQKYEEAASEAAKFARDKMLETINEGRAHAEEVIGKVMTEVPFDQVVPAPKLKFGHVSTHAGTIVEFDGRRDRHDETYHYEITPHAFGQICERAHLPMSYATHLRGQSEWGQQLLASNLNTIFGHHGDRFLLRSYKDRLRGFLSSAYRRLDSRPLLEAFAEACKNIGAVPVEGYGSETKIALKAMLPMVFEPVPNEVMCLGVCWENSDYGNGAHTVRMFVLRLWCTNFAIANEDLKQIHLGKRLTEDIDWSQETYNLDTQATASAIRDIVKKSLDPENVNGYLDMVRKANEESVGPQDMALAVRDLRRRLNKSEVDAIQAAYDSQDVHNLPPGKSLWRLSNAVSWVAKTIEDTDRRIDAMKVAGAMLEKAA